MTFSSLLKCHRQISLSNLACEDHQWSRRLYILLLPTFLPSFFLLHTPPWKFKLHTFEPTLLLLPPLESSSSSTFTTCSTLSHLLTSHHLLTLPHVLTSHHLLPPSGSSSPCNFTPSCPSLWEFTTIQFHTILSLPLGVHHLLTSYHLVSPSGSLPPYNLIPPLSLPLGVHHFLTSYNLLPSSYNPPAFLRVRHFWGRGKWKTRLPDGAWPQGRIRSYG